MKCVSHRGKKKKASKTKEEVNDKQAKTSDVHLNQSHLND